MDNKDPTTQVNESETKREVLTYEEVEKIVNATAQQIAKKIIGSRYRFQIYFVNHTSPHVKLERGTTVKLYFCGITPKDKDFGRILRESLRKVPLLQDSYELEVRNVMFERQKEAKKFTKIKFKDKTEVLPLLPLYRTQVEEITVYRITDKVSGESVTITSDGSRTSKTIIDEARFLLGRRVLENESDDEREDCTTDQQEQSNVQSVQGDGTSAV